MRRPGEAAEDDATVSDDVADLASDICEQDLSLEPPDTPLPEAVAKGTEPYLIIGAIAGG
jgi:hypothetical protein